MVGCREYLQQEQVPRTAGPFVNLKSTIIAFILICFIPTTVLAAAENLALPDIGDSSATSLTPADEKRIGQDMMRSIRQSGSLINDPEIENYVRNLGYRLVSASDEGAAGFNFYVIDNPTINAFAMPGGYVVIHSGLILASRSESELAGVMAHEIAHVTQHHLARSYEKASQMNMPLTAAVIAAILLGASNPQMGQAALAASMAGGTQAQLDFTRANEREADRVGMQMLAGAGFDPNGMPSFFERLQQEYRFASSGLPEFLSTHPVTLNRIADSRNRAAQYPHGLETDSINYHLIKAKLRVLEAKDPAKLAQRVGEDLAQGRYDNQTAERYTYALALQRTGQYAEAHSQLQRLLKQDPGRIAYLLALASVEADAKQPAAARAVYRKGLDLYPDNALLTLSYAAFMLQQQDNRNAAALLQEYTRTRSTPARAYELLAEAESRNGNKGISHIALADYYQALGETPTAIEQLLLARRSRGLDFYHQSLIEAKLTQLRDQQSPTSRRSKDSEKNFQ